MNIAPEWKRIAGIHMDKEGLIGAVWLAYDPSLDRVYVYDACLFRNEVPVIITEGLNARGRWIPIAWPEKAKDLSKELLERGCNMLHDPIKDSDSLTEINSRQIEERLRTKRLSAEKRLAEWLDEYKSFFRSESKVPSDGHPLMSATRHAVSELKYAKRQSVQRKTLNYPRLSIR